MLRLWLSRLRGPFFYLVVIAILAGGAYYSLSGMRTSLESYQPLQLEVAPVQSLINPVDPPDKTSPNQPGTTAPLTNRVVLVVVNGLGLDDVEAMPALQDETFKRISTGAYLFTDPVEPGAPALVTLLTGANVELTGGIQLDPTHPSDNTPTPRQQLNQFDNLFGMVKANRFTSALFGSQPWFEALPPATLDFYTTFDPRQPSTDITDNALNFLKKRSANFTLLQLGALGRAQQDYGLNSNQARLARQNLNTALSRLISDEMDLRHTTVIITGDWDDSVKAGDRWTVPLLMVGQAVQPGEKIMGRQEDVASTVAALLGIQIPRQNQGRILSSLLSMPAVDQGEKFLALAEQRQALDVAYRERLGLVLPLAVNDSAAVEAEKNVKLAQQNYRLGSYDGIVQVVDSVLRYTRTDMEEAQQEWFAQNRWQRAILAVVLLVLPLLLLLIWRSALAFLAAFAALVATTLPYLIYWVQGQHFAFNSISLPDLFTSSLSRSAVGLAVGLLIPLFFFDWAEKRRARRSGRVDLAYLQMVQLRRPLFPGRRLFNCCALLLGWMTYFNAFVWLVWYYWRYGYFAPLIDQPALLPAHNDSFLLFFALDHAFGFAIMMVAAPVVLITLYWFKRKLRGKVEEEEEQDILKKPRPETSIVKVS